MRRVTEARFHAGFTRLKNRLRDTFKLGVEGRISIINVLVQSQTGYFYQNFNINDKLQ